MSWQQVSVGTHLGGCKADVHATGELLQPSLGRRGIRLSHDRKVVMNLEEAETLQKGPRTSEETQELGEQEAAITRQ